MYAIVGREIRVPLTIFALATPLIACNVVRTCEALVTDLADLGVQYELAVLQSQYFELPVLGQLCTDYIGGPPRTIYMYVSSDTYDLRRLIFPQLYVFIVLCHYAA